MGFYLRPVGGGHDMKDRVLTGTILAATLLYHKCDLDLRLCLITDITHQASVLAGVLVNLQMLKQGHMGFVLLHRLSSNRVRVLA